MLAHRVWQSAVPAALCWALTMGRSSCCPKVLLQGRALKRLSERIRNVGRYVFAVVGTHSSQAASSHIPRPHSGLALVGSSCATQLYPRVPWEQLCAPPQDPMFRALRGALLCVGHPPHASPAALHFLWYLFMYSFFQTCMTVRNVVPGAGCLHSSLCCRGWGHAQTGNPRKGPGGELEMGEAGWCRPCLQGWGDGAVGAFECWGFGWAACARRCDLLHHSFVRHRASDRRGGCH